VRKFLRLGAAVAGVCLLSFGPFIWMGQLSQARVARLFRSFCRAPLLQNCDLPRQGCYRHSA